MSSQWTSTADSDYDLLAIYHDSRNIVSYMSCNSISILKNRQTHPTYILIASIVF